MLRQTGAATMIILTGLAAIPALAAGPIDRLLTESAPCRDIPGLSETESVALEQAVITVLPDAAEMTVAGRISCRSAEDALLAADASVRLGAEVSLNLRRCKATRTDVRLSEFEGSLGAVVEALSASLQQDLAKDVAAAAEDACRDLLSRK